MRVKRPACFFWLSALGDGVVVLIRPVVKREKVLMYISIDNNNIKVTRNSSYKSFINEKTLLAHDRIRETWPMNVHSEDNDNDSNNTVSE